MKAIECTTVAWVQEKRETEERQNRARIYSASRNYSAANTKRNRRKENINEILCGLMVGAFMMGFFLLGFIV